MLIGSSMQVHVILLAVWFQKYGILLDNMRAASHDNVHVFKFTKLDVGRGCVCNFFW